MTDQKQNLKHLFSGVTQYFTPRIVGEVNDVFIKLVKMKGQDVPWHRHDGEDELFFILKGCLTMEIKGRSPFVMEEGDLYIVKKGIEHRVHSEKECRLMLIENKTAKHTGDVASQITKTLDDQKY